MLSRSVGVAAALFVIFVASKARADRGTGLGGTIGGEAEWMPYVPTLSVPTTDTPTRRIPSGTLPSVGSLWLGGVTIDSRFVFRSRLLVPLFGFSGALAVGNSPAVTSTLDGSIVQERSWTAYRLEFLLPGIGARFTRRRWSFAGTVRGYVSVIGMDATVLTAGGSSDLSVPSRPGLGARADLSVCRRLDPVNRFCVFVAPSIYDFGFFNGGSAGLRWEVGP